MTIRSDRPLPAWKRLRQRLFAYMLSQDRSTAENFLAPRKRALLSSLRGNILEIGPGNGPNLRYLQPGVHWTGLEPNPYMHPHLMKTIRELGWPPDRYTIELGDPQGANLPVPDECMDAAISGHVLCSVPQPESILAEILRVLKPGGRLVFLEHVAAARGSRLRGYQDFIQPVWTLIGDGCHPNQETGEMIRRAGFTRVEIEPFEYPNGGLVSPHIWGWAEK